jgi:hypothetical protein
MNDPVTATESRLHHPPPLNLDLAVRVRSVWEHLVISVARAATVADSLCDHRWKADWSGCPQGRSPGLDSLGGLSRPA